MGDTNDSVIKRRLKAKRERDAQEKADQLAKDFRANCAKIFDLIDEDQSGTLSLPEIMLALKGKPDVLRFIKTCRNPVLSEFLVPPRVQAAMKEFDTNDDGELDRDEWKALSDRSLEAILERHALARGNDDEFIDEFLDMAVIVYDLIDEDMNGTLSKEELVKACGEDEDVIEFVVKCPLPELQDLLNPELLDKALSEMDTDDDGSISKDEWTEAVGGSLTKLLDERQKDRDADNEFAIDFQTKAREVFEMIDADDSWTLDKEELMDTSKDGIISLDEWDSAIAIALDKKLEQRAAARSRDKKVAADQRLAEAFDMNADSLEAVRDRKLAELEGRIDEDGNIISQEEMDRRAEEAEIARLKAIPRNAWGMPLSNRSSLLCAIM